MDEPVFSNEEPTVEETAVELENESVVSDLSEEQEQKERMQKAIKMRKKTLRTVIVIAACLIVIPMVLILILNFFFSDEVEYELIPIPQYSPMYYGEPYDGDVLQYDKYLQHDRNVYYYDNPAGYGNCETVTSAHSDPRLGFLYQYIQYTIDGNTEQYNASFSPVYLQINGAKKAFAQQMLYDICLYYVSEEMSVNGDRIYCYQLDYKILENNGTFRNDILSDECRSVFLKLRVSQNGTVMIEDRYLKQMAIIKNQ